MNGYTGKLDESFIAQFNAVVVTNAKSTEELMRISGYCHEHDIAFILAETRGLFGYIFTDLGKEFTVIDTNGEEPEKHIISSISQVISGEFQLPNG